MKKTIALALGLLASHFVFGQAATIAVGTPLSIFEGQQKVTVQTAKGPVTISRVMTPCGKNGGTLQPLVPVPGVHPATETEIIQALGDREALVVDMRDTNDRVKGTIPGSVGIFSRSCCMRASRCAATSASARARWARPLTGKSNHCASVPSLWLGASG